MKTQILGILCLISGALYSQTSDNFDDGDLTSLPSWTGDINFFTPVNKELQSNCFIANTIFSVSTSSVSAVNSEWLLDTRLLFNTSSLNYTDFVVISDSADIKNMKNGYFIRLGGTTDDISLYKTKNGFETRIIDGMDNVLNNSNNNWKIILRRTAGYHFILERQPLSGGTVVLEGNVSDSDILTSYYSGIRIKQSTASFFGKHYFDNFYAGKVLNDTVPPVLDSLILLTSKQLRCTFNEVCDSISMINSLNYVVKEGLISPESVQYINGKGVLLNFKEPFLSNKWLNLTLKNINDTAGNSLNQTSRLFYYSKADTAEIRSLLITELFPDPDPVVGLPNLEYVEITNVSGKFIQLNGCKINDPTVGRNLPDIVLAPDSIIVLTNIPALNNSGDRIWITNQKDEVIHAVNYSDQWYKDNTKKNGGWSLEMINLKNICAGSSNWMASINPKGGTPGLINSVKDIGPPDNSAPKIISIIPVNDTVLHITFDEEIDSINSLNASISFNSTKSKFRLKQMSSNLIEVDWLIDFKQHPDSSYIVNISGIKDCSGNTLTNKSFSIQWPSESQRNDVIFNEILFNPKPGGSDYIEIYNNSSKAFDLSRHFIAVLDDHNQYKSIDRLTISPVLIRPYQYLLLSADTLSVCEQYACKHDNALKLEYNKMPSMPDDKGNLLLINLSGRITDSLRYSEDWHFPLLSDKEGVSLERISFNITARSVDNWQSAASVAGYGTPGYLNSQASAGHETYRYFTLQNKTVSPDEDGFEDALLLNYKLPDQNFTTSINIYDVEGRLIRQWVNNETLGTEGFISWNGTDFNSQKAGIGMYILAIECTNIDGQRIKEKMSFTVAGKF